MAVKAEGVLMFKAGFTPAGKASLLKKETPVQSCCSVQEGDPSLHWEKVYLYSDHEKLGWYEEQPWSLSLIQQLDLPAGFSAADAGSGVSCLAACLLDGSVDRIRGESVFLIDISETALNTVKHSVPAGISGHIHYIKADLGLSQSLPEQSRMWGAQSGNPVPENFTGHLWHDRAVLHFLTDDTQVRNYRHHMDQFLISGGWAVIGAFSEKGAERCSGLPVRRYSEKAFRDFFGEGYTETGFYYTDYTMPSGEIRPYIYPVFRKK